MIAFDTDIHAVAGLLKRYFRELPDPLFTDELYLNFVQALGMCMCREARVLDVTLDVILASMKVCLILRPESSVSSLFCTPYHLSTSRLLCSSSSI